MVLPLLRIWPPQPREPWREVSSQPQKQPMQQYGVSLLLLGAGISEVSALQVISFTAALILTAESGNTSESSQSTGQKIANGHAGNSVEDGGHLDEFADLGIYDAESLGD
jgi:hypothetical protein